MKQGVRMKKEKLKDMWSKPEEREIILHRFSRNDNIMDIGKELNIDWFKKMNRIPFYRKKKAIKLIAKKLDNIKDLQRLINKHEVEDNPIFPAFQGEHYRAEIKENEILIEGKSSRITHMRTKDKVKEVISDDLYLLPFIRGILLSGEEYGSYLHTDFQSAISEGKKFYEGDTFYPTNKVNEPERIPGVTTSSPNSGRYYRIKMEFVPLIWKALEEYEKETLDDMIETEKLESPERGTPKFKEVLDNLKVTNEDIEEFKEILSNNEALDYWSGFIAPQVKYRIKAKKSILCMLASPEDKHGNKGRTNVIIFGPPGTGKTAFKDFLTSNFGTYSIDGSRVSKADLTYNKNNDKDGLLVRAHKGLAIIEEADKMDHDAMGASLTALGETGRIEIRDMRLPVEVRGVMLGNYRSKEQIREEHGDALFNRFEFVLEFDKLDEDELDDTLDWHYKHFRKEKQKENSSKLKKYIKWVRDFEPDISDEELEKINEFRKKKVDKIQNVRGGISLMIVAYTIARLNHRNLTLEDFEKAFELVKTD